MMAPEVELEKSVEITEVAIEKIQEVMKQYEETLYLRLFVQGGCCGVQMGMALDRQVRDDDIIMDKGPLKVVVDPMSFQYVQGSKVDYMTEGDGGFVITNENLAQMQGAACDPAGAGCGCGPGGCC